MPLTKHRACLCLILAIGIYSFNASAQTIKNPDRKGNQFIFWGESYQHFGRDTSKGQIRVEPFKAAASRTTATNRIGAVIFLSVTTIQPTCGTYDGTIVISATGGTDPYTFYEPRSGLRNTGNYPRLPAGTYNFVVTDANGDEATTSVTLTDSFPLVVATLQSWTNASSCTSWDVSATVNAANGTPPYTYSIDGVNYQTSNTFTGLTAGLYVFHAKDANGCIGKVASTNTLANVFSNVNCEVFGLGFTQYTCGNNAYIAPSAQYPNPPYTFSLDGVTYSEGPFYNLGPGIYPIRFRDALGNIRICAITIFPFCQVLIDFITVDAACQQNDGALTVAASYGRAPYTYTIDGVNYQPGNTFASLRPGSYYVTVRDADGVTNSLGAYVYDKCPQISLTSTIESCAKNDGTITATATNGIAPYQYSIDGINFQADNNFTDLPAAIYHVTVRDDLGSTKTGTATVEDGCLQVSLTATDASCGNANGQLSIAVNPAGTYFYSIDGIAFQVGSVFSGLPAGTYTVTVKDASGIKTGSSTSTINNNSITSATLSVTPESCSSKDGSITVNTLSGSELLFSLDNINFQSSNLFTSLAAGNYTVFVSGGGTCVLQLSTEISAGCPSLTVTLTNETCSSGNGTLRAKAEHGTEPYLYSINGSSFQPNEFFTFLSAGNYNVTVKDALNVMASVNVLLENLCPLVTVVVDDGLCGLAQGTITATGSNGAPPYQYSLDGINFQTSPIFTGLADGLYIVSIKDNMGSLNTATAVLKNYQGPKLTVHTADATCINNNGRAEITGIGGTGLLLYAIDGSTYQPTNTFTRLSSGQHVASVKDANGCLSSEAITIKLTNDLTLSAIDELSICERETATLIISSNADSYTWTPARHINDVNLKAPKVSPSASTSYFVKAVLGTCILTDSISVSVNAAPVANAGRDSIICSGQSVQLTGTGGLQYEWSPVEFLNDAYSAVPWVVRPTRSVAYKLTVTDAMGCKSLDPAILRITVTPPPKVFAGNDTALVANEPFQLHAVDMNGSGFTTYNWTPAYGLNDPSSQNPIGILGQPSTYKVTAVTSAGCEGSDEILVKVYAGPEMYVPTAFSPNGDGVNDKLTFVTVGIKEFKYFAVFNRNGNMVYHTTTPTGSWDGRVRGLPQTTGSYVWVIEGVDKDGKNMLRKGIVVLLR